MFIPVFTSLTFLLLQSATAEFIPARDHDQKTVPEWIADLEHSHGRSLGAIWSLYYAGERTREVIEALKKGLVTTDDAVARRALDTILSHWSVACEAPSARAYVGGQATIAADQLFPPPRRLGATTPKPSGEILTTLEQVIGALLKNRETDIALDTIVCLERERQHTPLPGVDGEVAIAHTHAWARAFAGSAYGEAFARHLRHESARTPFDAREWGRLLDEIPELGRGSFAAGRALLEALDGPLERASPARAALEKLLPFIQSQASEAQIHWRLGQDDGIDPDEQQIVTELAIRMLDQEVAAQDLRRLHATIVSTPMLAGLIQGRLLELARRQDDTGLEALRILGHMGVRDAMLRQRYLDVVRAWNDFSDNALERFPCWRLHDDETLAALAEVLDRAGARRAFQFRLWFAGLTDARRSPIAMRYLSDPVIRSHGDGLVVHGFRGLFPLEPDERIGGRVNQLALRIATLKDDGKGFSAEEAELASLLLVPPGIDDKGSDDGPVDLGLFLARTLGLRSDDIVSAAFDLLRRGSSEDFSANSYEAAAYLNTARLSLEQELELRRLLPWSPPVSRGWWDVDTVAPTDTGPLQGQLAIELVPQIRMAIYGGLVQALDDLLAITRLVPRDEDYLLAVIDRGPAEAREWAVGLVRRRNLDTIRIRAAVGARGLDFDGRVCRAAQRLIAERGW